MAREVVTPHRLARLLGAWYDGDATSADKLAEALRGLIVTGRISPGGRLPSERQFAPTIGLARATVGQAFSLLREEGLLRSQVGVGTFVSTSGISAGARGDARLQSYMEQPPAGRIDLRSAAVRGLPMVFEELGRLSSVDFEPHADTHGYVPKGLPDLRDAIATYYYGDEVPTTSDQIVVTSGAQQAVNLVAKSLLEAGDVVIIEEPTYRGSLETLRAAGARLVSVPTGPGGIDVEQLRLAFERQRPKMVLLQSTVHNPTGATIGADARREIGRLAELHGVTILDDTSNSDLLFSDRRLPPFAADPSRVISVGTSSKLFWGGLRVGWIRADRHLLTLIASVKNVEDLGTSLPSQIATIKLLRRTDEARACRRHLLREAHAQTMGWLASMFEDWTVQPITGGASLWIKLPEGRSATTFSEHARRNGIDILAGPTFSLNSGCDDFLRLSFATQKPDVVLEGLERLRTLWRQEKPGSHSKQIGL